MSTAAPVSGSWADVLAEGRLPRFALICLGVWLNAADSLITATIMPSVGRSLGGYPYFGWATAGYLLGSVLAGASSGVLALRFGLRSATAAAALLYAAGCALSAVAPEIFSFLAGRILQGIGGGWVVGLCSVAISMLFANRLLPRVYSAISSVWGIAVLVGPMLGGLFADAGSWRAVFWLFAVQGAAVAAAAWVMLPAAEADGRQPRGGMAAAWPGRGRRDADRPGRPGGRFRAHRRADRAGRRRVPARAAAGRAQHCAAAAARIGRPAHRAWRRLCHHVPAQRRGDGPAGVWSGRPADPARPVGAGRRLCGGRRGAVLDRGLAAGRRADRALAGAADPAGRCRDPRRAGALRAGVRRRPPGLGGVRRGSDRHWVRPVLGLHQPAHPGRPGRRGAGDRRRGHRDGAADRRRGRVRDGRGGRQPRRVRRRLLGAGGALGRRLGVRGRAAGGGPGLPHRLASGLARLASARRPG